MRCSLACRIIPADAGSTKTAEDTATDGEDHPRGCGEHQIPAVAQSGDRGSSPRMRGAPDTVHIGWSEVRIIPADAGSTRRLSECPTRSRDHPRGCGEHVKANSLPGITRGSSPRMRGAPAETYMNTIKSRIIPADAGSTLCRRPCENATWDHPRGCGEHSICTCAPRTASGSSPRMRGALHDFLLFRSMLRIIPADAGST